MPLPSHSLPGFNVDPELLPEASKGSNRNITKTFRIDEDLEQRLEYVLHDPTLGFHGQFTSFAIWCLEQGLQACAVASTDAHFRSMQRAYIRMRAREERQRHILTLNEQLAKEMSALDQWMNVGDLDAAMSWLEDIVDQLEDVPPGNWSRFLAHKIMDAEATTRTLNAANAGTAAQRQRAAAVTAALEAATGQ